MRPKETISRACPGRGRRIVGQRGPRGRAAGLEAPEFRETHRAHEHAATAIIRARKPIEVEAALVAAEGVSLAPVRCRAR
jgi:hypothetical protein